MNNQSRQELALLYFHNHNETTDAVTANHNETLVETTQKTNSAQPKLVKLSAEDLTLICGGRSKEDSEPSGSD